MKNKEKLMYCGLSDMGRQRTNNEDAYVAEQLDENTILAVAIDGVGGYEGGEVAAEIAKTEIPKYLHEFQNGERIELLKQAVISANNAIYDQRQIDAVRPNMSCVLTSAIVDKGRKVIDMVHVGDTRLYQYRHGELRKLSHDHSLIGYREEVGDLSEEEAMHHPQRNVISRDVGSGKHGVEDRDFLEAEEFPLLPNSTLLLCSDGLTDLITSKQIVAILEQQISLQKKAKALIAAANEAGGKDNITVVLVEYHAEEKAEPMPKMIENELIQPIEDNNDDVLSPEDEGKKKGSKKLIVGILCGSVVLLLAACIALGLLSMKKNNQAKGLELQVLQLKNQIEQLMLNDTTNVDTLPITLNDSAQNPVRTIARYKKAVEVNDFKTISESFADHVQRYIKHYNMSNEDVVKCHKMYDGQFGVTNKRVSVRWDTWTTNQNPNGEASVDYVEDYSFDIIDTFKTKFSKYELLYHVTFDKDGKIVSIYYDELSKSR